MFEEEAIALAPVNFFRISADCRFLSEKGAFPRLDDFKRYLLPELTQLCADESFARVAMGWNREGLEFCIEVNAPVERVAYPNIQNGDSIELFIDTRDVKTSGFNTRFCHHFYFLPEPVDGKQAGEITRFRTEDKHDWCDPTELVVKVKKSAKGYVAKIFIPAQCLHGYDPEQCAQIGFTYRINRYGEIPQHFSVDTEDYQLEQQPSLWSSIQLNAN